MYPLTTIANELKRIAADPGATYEARMNEATRARLRQEVGASSRITVDGCTVTLEVDNRYGDGRVKVEAVTED